MEGMQPTFRHVPPSDPLISTHVVYKQEEEEKKKKKKKKEEEEEERKKRKKEVGHVGKSRENAGL